ncbi:MAG: GAF domain-containing protein [Nitrospinota bacterium]
MEHERSYFETFREVSRILTSTLDIQEVVRSIAHLTTEAARVKGCSILLLKPKENRLELLANHGLSERYLQKGPLDADRSLAESLQGVPVRIRDVVTDPRVQYPAEAQAEGIASMLSVPMRLKGRIIGVLRLYSENPHDFPEPEVEFASALAELGAVALENARLYSQLRRDYEKLVVDFSTWFDAGVSALREVFPSQGQGKV